MTRISPRSADRLSRPVAPAVLTIITIAAVLAAALPARAAVGTIDLRNDRGRLPYRFLIVATDARGLARERGWITHLRYADAGDDGVDDSFRANDHGICGTPWTPAGAGKDWQTNLPAAFARKGPCGSIDGVWDLDGDGRTEVVASAGTPDGFRWQLSVIDAATGALKWRVDLPAGIDSYGDGNWDGFFRAFGPFTAHLADGPRAALLVGIEAGHDKRPRGVLALDARDGTELWRHLTAAKPIAADVHVVDLDADGRQEICLLGAGVANFEPGEQVDGADDHHAMLYVLNDDGTLRWRRQLGEAPASGWLETTDLEGDGRAELVVTAFLPDLQCEALAVLAGDGTVIASAALPAVCHGLAVRAGGGGAATAWLTFDGRARRYELTRGAVTPGPEAAFEGPAQVALVADLVGDARPEVLLGTAGGSNWLVDENLSPLALLRDTDIRCLKEGTSLRRLPDGARRLVVLGDPAHASGEFVVEDNPRSVPWELIVAGLGVAGGAGLAWRRRASRISTATLRELRLQVLDRLEALSHGKLAALGSARSLAFVVRSFESGMIDAAQMREDARDPAADLFGVDLPNLEAVLEVAVSAELDPLSVQQAQDALVRLRESADAVLAAPEDPAAPAADTPAPGARLSEAIEDANARFRLLRQCVEWHFSTAPDDILARSLKAHAREIARLGVEVERWPQPAPACIIHQDDLTFVLDNLVENALRAMEGTATRRLVLAWRTADEMVVITVRDTGAGMTAAAAAAALEPGEGKRAGGGRGLPGSRRRLLKYGGKLSVGASAPGQGTTMVLHLKPAPQAATPASPGSTHEPERH